MQISNKENYIKILFNQYSGQEAASISALPLSGSERRYYRVKSHDKKTIIAVFNSKIAENETFFYFSRVLAGAGFKVPEIYSISDDRQYYLQQDLGDSSLLNLLETDRKFNGTIAEETVNLYKRVLSDLAKLQIHLHPLIDYGKCYQPTFFDKKSMLSDCNLFKYWYLYPIQAEFDEDALEKDFEDICSYLDNRKNIHFMYRDFQARNIMIHQNEPYFIDFQGGRKGPLQYDVASLLFQAKAALPQKLRAELLEYYLHCLEQYIPVDRKVFKENYEGFVLLRSLQVLGAYGFKGFFQKKEHFLNSIPYALNNIEYWLNKSNFPLKIPELRKLLESISKKRIESERETMLNKFNNKCLTLHIRSFSYKKGLPEDVSKGHGQGYIFDCRIIHNPGRYEEYKHLSGLDDEVKKFLSKEQEMHDFLKPVFNILDQAVNKFIERDFEYLGINFGCTGGQHRSVFAAEAAALMLREKYGHQNINIIIEHREKDNWKKKT